MIEETNITQYYAVIFTSIRTSIEGDYEETSNKMVEFARKQPGFVGVESAREKLGITVSYWQDLKSIENWNNHAEHVIAREKGRKDWYSEFQVCIAKVEREYQFKK